VLIADARDEESLRSMAKSTKILINTVGPFRLYGRPVVQACIQEKTWYLDVCGEPEFMESVEYEMDMEARKQGCYIASAVGFDSVPTDLGNLCVSSAFEAPAQCSSVETFIELQSGPKGIAGHFPTYESAVYGLGSSKKLSELRKKASRQRSVGKIVTVGPRVPMKKAGTFDDRIGSYLIPFMGSCPSVIRRSLVSLAQDGKAVFQSRVYMGVPSFWIFLQYVLPLFPIWLYLLNEYSCFFRSSSFENKLIRFAFKAHLLLIHVGLPCLDLYSVSCPSSPGAGRCSSGFQVSSPEASLQKKVLASSKLNRHRSKLHVWRQVIRKVLYYTFL
jgi:hypothetical protein